MASENGVSWLDETKIFSAMSRSRETDASLVREVLAKALLLKGLSASDVIVLSSIRTPDLTEELFETARKVKEEIYGNRLVLFAPLYVSNLCRNECLYCAFRLSNKEVKRRALNQEEIAQETRILIKEGHKRLLVVAGEAYPQEGLKYVIKTIETIYGIKEGQGEIRRVNANIAPLSLPEFKELKSAGIGTYQLFQETYHRETYRAVHVGGVKTDFNWRVTAMDRAMEAGIDDVGVGILFGLHDWRFEILALLQHIEHLEEQFGVGCHTISVPRIEPAVGSELASNPPFPVTDEDFKKIVAVLRLAVPYTGIIMSTRETPNIRRETFALGVSQISAGSRTNPGGYSEDRDERASQFQLGDHRPLSVVIKDISELGYIPSFCTACYRLGRTGQDFMDLAKPGLIKEKCAPNALSTFMEYLLDYAPEDTRLAGEKAVQRELDKMDPETRNVSRHLLAGVLSGKRDVYC